MSFDQYANFIVCVIATLLTFSLALCIGGLATLAYQAFWKK